NAPIEIHQSHGTNDEHGVILSLVRRFVSFLFVLALASAPATMPPIPPLPQSGWPSAESAEPFARELLAHVPAGALARTLAEKPELMPAILRNLGSALMSNDSALRERLIAYVAAVAASAGRGRAEARPTSLSATI